MILCPSNSIRGKRQRQEKKVRNTYSGRPSSTTGNSSSANAHIWGAVFW